MVTTYRQAMTTDANTGSGTSNGTVFLMDSTMPSGTDETTVRYLRQYAQCFKLSRSKVFRYSKSEGIIIFETLWYMYLKSIDS